MAEANKDEADKCKRIAQTALAAGDSEKAVRFLQKAKRMCPSDASIDQLLAEAASAPSSGGGGEAGGASASASRAASEPQSAPEGPRYRGSASTAGAAAAGGKRVGKDGSTYTTEQMQLAQKILRTKDYYDILDLPRDANEDAVKKAYKKIALKLHPDKNKAPGAEEAFKKVSKAVQCLTDQEKKQVYDRYGDEERIPQSQRGHYQQDFMTPEDLFAAFFGGGAVFHSHHGHARNHHSGHGQSEQVPRAHMLQMLPVIFLVLVGLASNFASRDAGTRFSFSETTSYRNERSSASLGITYWVTDEFEDHYPQGTKYLAEFDRQVEIYYVRTVQSDCDKQDNMMYRKVMLAKRTGNAAEVQKARNHPRPKCREMEKIKSRHKDIWRAAMYFSPY
jgi:curved DNA-binding protein CbpA